ncbi:4-hydroxy-tetrahydrodipicolinate synthase [Caldicellulosiruptoraceae bacterium PP1]
MSLFKGSGVALITPFKDDESVDYEVLARLVDFHLESKTDAIIVCGTTGEPSTMPDDEHLEVIRFVIDRVAGKKPVIAGTGSNDTKHAVELSIKAQELGADGLLHVTPYYNKTTQKGLIAHFSKIAEKVSIPIILYNVPSRTGLNITPETVKELSTIPNIRAIKEASSNIVQIAEIAQLCPDIDIYSGNDDQIVPILSLGGIGVISVLANILPNETHDIVEYFLNGDIKKAKELQLKLLPIIKALFIEVNPIPVKEALNMMGFNVGKPRLPLVPMSEKNKEILKKALLDYGIKLVN